jgi:small subunit ribosomal protein S20
MANIKSAKKSAKQNEVRRKRNLSRRTAIKTAIKRVVVAVEQKDQQDSVQELLNQAYAKLSRAKTKGLLHRNTVARKMSRLAHRVAKAAAAQA